MDLNPSTKWSNVDTVWLPNHKLTVLHIKFLHNYKNKNVIFLSPFETLITKQYTIRIRDVQLTVETRDLSHVLPVDGVDMNVSELSFFLAFTIKNSS